MWPKKPDEKAEDFAYADDPEFSTIWRKLARWAADNVRIIKGPEAAAAARNRRNANWKLLLQIAQHAGGGWPEQARRFAIYLSRAPYEPSVGVQLLAVLRAMFTKNRTEIEHRAGGAGASRPIQDWPWHEYRGRSPITKNQVAARAACQQESSAPSQTNQAESGDSSIAWGRSPASPKRPPRKRRGHGHYG